MVRLLGCLRFQRKIEIQEGDEKIIKNFSKEFKSTELLEQKLNDYRKIQDRNDYNCVNAASSFLSKVIAHLELVAGVGRDDVLEFLNRRDNFNLEELIDHFTKYGNRSK